MTSPVGFSDSAEAAILNCYIGGTSITAPAACYLGVYSVAPDDAGSGGTELSGNGYARKSCRANFATPATNGQTGISNDTSFDMATASGAWSAGVAVGLFAASSGGTPFAVTPATLGVLAIGQFHHFPIASLVFTLT